MSPMCANRRRDPALPGSSKKRGGPPIRNDGGPEACASNASAEPPWLGGKLRGGLFWPAACCLLVACPLVACPLGACPPACGSKGFVADAQDCENE